MQAISGGRALVLDHFVFYTADDWLMAIAYPLLGGGSSPARFKAALDEALRQSGARPALPRDRICRHVLLPVS